MSFTDHLRQLATPIWDAQLTHPFVVALGKGTLPERKFKYYILQDARFLGDLVEIQMSAPHSLRLDDRLHAADEVLHVHSINTGVPHAVVFVDDLENTDVRHLGRTLRYHAHFAPRGTNANFVQQRAADTIAIRTYERGVEDETLACGTGMAISP